MHGPSMSLKFGLTLCVWVLTFWVKLSLTDGTGNKETDRSYGSGVEGSRPNPASLFPAGDPRRCMVAGVHPNFRFEVLPGTGWDNLQNKELGRIVHFNYSQCRTTDDGQFLLPDNVYTIPLKRSKLEKYAELFEHWENYTSTVSRSINVHAGLHLSHFGISGKFSHEYESVKTKQHFDKSVTVRTQARYLMYVSKLEPDMAVSEQFQKRLMKVAAALALNRTDVATYESQLIVRDFGTHVTTSVDAGAALVQVDQVNTDYMKTSSTKKTTILASASASFFGVFDIGGDYSQTTTEQQVKAYLQQRTSSHVSTYGGPVYKPKNFSIVDWGSQVQNNLVAVDRAGDPIYYLVSNVNLPGVSDSVVYDVYDYVKKAVEVYYEHNTHRGCMNQDSPSFDFAANVDDGTCKPPKTNFTFGGVYQQCQNFGRDNLCSGLTQQNPQTGGYNCPSGYEAVLLQSGQRSSSRSEKKCHRCWLIAHCCHTETYNSRATYTAYWCAATGKVPQNSGFLFGGLYTPTVVNVVTQSKSCPEHFYKLTLLNSLTICVSDDYELGSRYALPFAGFFSCNAGNPLALKEREGLLKSSNGGSMLMNFMKQSGAGSYPHVCPDGYSQHLAVVDNGCSINYCVKAGFLSDRGLPRIQRPPFMEAPKTGFMELQDSDIIMTDDGEVWTSLSNADEVMPKYLKQKGFEDKVPELMVQDDGSQSNSDGSKSSSVGLSGGGIAAIVISATVVCAGISVGVAYKVRRGRTRYREEDPWRNPESRRITSGARNLGYNNIESPNAVTTT